MAAVESVIHDLGYRRYAGPRLGRRSAVLAMFTYSLRTAFGLGRGAKTKIFPWSIAALVGGVAAVAAAFEARTGETLISYPRFSEGVSYLTVLFVAAVAPELVSRDLASGVLALYFSRPPRRWEYSLAKLAALVSAVWLLLGIPLLVMFAGAAFSTVDGARDLLREAGDAGQGVLFAGLHAVVIGSIGLLAAALTKRRAFAAALVVGVFVVTMPVVGVVTALGTDPLPQLAGLGNPLLTLAGLQHWWFAEGGFDVGSYGPGYAAMCLALVGSATGFLLLRYRKVMR